MYLIKLQLEELTKELILELKGMLDPHATIKTQRETKDKFDKPSTNPPVAGGSDDGTGGKTFIPNSLQMKWTIKCSKTMRQ